MLSTRTKNALWNVLMEDGGWGYRASDWMPDPQAVARLDPNALHRAHGIGKVAMQEIEDYLRKNGLTFSKTREAKRWNLSRLREREQEILTSLLRLRTAIAELEKDLEP